MTSASFEGVLPDERVLRADLFFDPWRTVIVYIADFSDIFGHGLLGTRLHVFTILLVKHHFKLLILRIILSSDLENADVLCRDVLGRRVVTLVVYGFGDEGDSPRRGFLEYRLRGDRGREDTSSTVRVKLGEMLVLIWPIALG